MLDGALGLLDGAALHGEHDVARAVLADDLDDFGPVNHSITAGAAHRRAGDLATLGAALLDGDVLGVQVHQPFDHALQPLVGILPAQEGVAGVEVDADAGALDQSLDAVQAVGMFAVLLVALDANEDAARLGYLGRLHQRVAHQDKVLGLGAPARLGAFVGVDHRRAALGGETDRLLEVFGADLRLDQRRVGGEAGELHARPLAGALDAQRVVEHGDAVEVARFAEQLAAPVDHRLDVRVAEFGGPLNAPFEGLVVVTDEFEINANVDFAHSVLVGTRSTALVSD